MQLETMNSLLHFKLSSLYECENAQISKLPGLAAGATNPELRAALTEHLAVTQQQRARLDECFEALGNRPEEGRNSAIEGLLADTALILAVKRPVDPDVVDAALIAAVQAIKHYEIACYGASRAWAEQLGLAQCANLLQQSLLEDSEEDLKLNAIALIHINVKAESIPEPE
jgi:ferritin-like metal-binding protein YciE